MRYGYVTSEQYDALEKESQQISAMLTGLIKHKGKIMATGYRLQATGNL